MDFIDIVSKVAPGTALKMRYNSLRYEATANSAKQAKRLYDAATQNQYRKSLGGNYSSPDSIVSHAGVSLRNMARHLEENHDLTNAVFDDLLNNVIGAGCSKVPMIKNKDGSLNEELNQRLCELFDEWSQSPETTGDLGFEQLERMVARHVWRDGEMFIRPIINNQRFNYQTRIPYAIDLIDADFCPLDYQAHDGATLHGIKVNQWGAAQTYFFYKTHPNDLLKPATQVHSSDLKSVAAKNIMHLKMVKRLRQRRGIPLIHSVINRMQDIKDYEESERIAAKVAADFTFFIKKSGEAGAPTALNTDGNRSFGMAAGTGFELQPGEDVGTIDSSRPNTGLADFRNAMLRAVAGGTGTRFSSISKDYNGTYSAQRQELVEGAISYRAHFNYFVRRFYRPVWEQFVTVAVLSGLLGSQRDLSGLDKETLTRCEFRPPSLPWIDPQKEAKAWETLVTAKLESRQEIMRQRGRDPSKVMEEMQSEADSDLFGSIVEMAEPENMNDEPEEEQEEQQQEAG